MIFFNLPTVTGKEIEYIKQAINNSKICGDGMFSKKCSEWIENNFCIPRALFVTSGSAALDMAAILCDIKPGDEVILPSFTFSSTANAFVLRGAKLVFVDIRPDTMNIDEKKIEEAITNKTKVICVVHYAGVGCEMDKIMDIAKRNSIYVVEDAAQAMMSKYKGRYLGSIGDFGCYSFHETKNYSSGEGGAILINNRDDIERSEIIREKGTNRAQFFRGQVAKYNWVECGDSFLQSDINAAYLYAQLEIADTINKKRKKIWDTYYAELGEIIRVSHVNIMLPIVPHECEHNSHMFYIKLGNLNERQDFISFMKAKGIVCSFHYVPLHSSPAGIKYGVFSGKDEWTTKESERLVRLPIYYNMTEEEQEVVIGCVKQYIRSRF